MVSLVQKISSMASGLLEDSSKVDMIIGKGFSHFDKDRSGFIESHEIHEALQHMLSVAHLPQVPPQMLDAVFAKAAGADMKINKQEFVQLFKKLLAKITGHPDVVAEAATANGYTA